MRRQEAKSVVAPVVSQTELDQSLVVHELMHRHQFDRGDVQGLQVLDHHRVRHTGVGAPEFLGNPGMVLRHALDVRLIDDCLVVRGARRMVGAPVKERVDHHTGHGVAQRVDHRRGATGGGVIGVQVVGIQRLTEIEVAVEGLAVRVQEQLAGVTAQSGGGVPRPVHPEPVALPGGYPGQVGVPHESVDLVEIDPGLMAGVVDQTQLHVIGHLGEHREVGARAVIGRAQGVRGAGPDGGLHGFACHGSTLSADRTSRGGCHHQPVAAPIWRPSSGVRVRM